MRTRRLYFHAAHEQRHRLNEFQRAHGSHRSGEPGTPHAEALLRPAFDTKNNYPLSNLYVSMLQRLGIESKEFATGNGTMRRLDIT